MKRAIYVDYENVNLHGLEAIERLGSDDYVKIFIGAQTTRLSMVDANRIFNCEAQVELITNKYIGKNALDFIIMVYMGYDIAKELANAYFVVSNDKGYDPAIHQMRKLSGHTVQRKSDISFVLKEKLRDEEIKQSEAETSAGESVKEKKTGVGRRFLGLFGFGKEKDGDNALIKSEEDSTESIIVGKGRDAESAKEKILSEFVKSEEEEAAGKRQQNGRRNNQRRTGEKNRYAKESSGKSDQSKTNQPLDAKPSETKAAENQNRSRQPQRRRVQNKTPKDNKTQDKQNAEKPVQNIEPVENELAETKVQEKQARSRQPQRKRAQNNIPKDNKPQDAQTQDNGSKDTQPSEGTRQQNRRRVVRKSTAAAEKPASEKEKPAELTPEEIERKQQRDEAFALLASLDEEEQNSPKTAYKRK